MRIPQRVGRWLRAEQGSQGLEAAGAALAAALIVLALLAGARGVLGPAVERAFQCAAAALVGGGAGCGGAAGETVQAQPASTSPPAETPQQQEQCGAWCQVGGVFKGGGEVLWETVKGIGTLAADGFKAATGDQATRDKYAAAWDAIRNDPGGAARAIWDGIADPIAEDWRAGRKGEAAGRVVTEILSVIGGPKGVDKLSKLGKVDDLARAAGRTDDLTDVQRAVDRLPCITAAPVGKGPGLAKPLEMPCSRSEYDKLRKKTPSQTIRDKINAPADKKDPVYGFDVAKFEADHIVAMKEIVEMPGFDKLTDAQKIEVLNLEDNFMGLSKRSNASKQDKTWTDWQGHKELGPVPPDVRREMVRREGDARRALQRAIDDRLNPPTR